VRDLAGTILDNVMSELVSLRILNDLNSSKKLKVLGRFIFQYISVYLKHGEEDKNFLINGLSLPLWNWSKLLKESWSTNQFIEYIAECVRKHFHTMHSCNIHTLYDSNRVHFFQLKLHLEMLCNSTKSVHLRKLCKSQLDCMRYLLIGKVQILAICDLADYQIREKIIRWIVYNEEKVWKERGRRPYEGNLRFFLDFVRDVDADPSNKIEYGYRADHFGNAAFGGFLLIRKDSSNAQSESETFTKYCCCCCCGGGGGGGDDDGSIIGYLIGDYIAKDHYEAVTAWVDHRYKGMTLSMKLYFQTMFEVRKRGCSLFSYDIIHGGLDRIIHTDPFLRALTFFRIDRFIYISRHDSYETKLSTTSSEKFERITIRLNAMLMSMKLSNCLQIIASVFYPRLISKRNIDNCIVQQRYVAYKSMSKLELTRSFSTKKKWYWLLVPMVAFGFLLSRIYLETGQKLPSRVFSL